jgi:hypothetical protein
LPGYPVSDDRRLDIGCESEVDKSCALVARDVRDLGDDPRLALTVIGAEIPGGELRVWVEVGEQATPRT